MRARHPSLPEQTDVLIIGGGHAALCAAITAAEQGASVTVLESAPQWMRGGNSRHTRNMRTMHETPIATLTGAYPEEEYWQDLARVTAGNTNVDLARLSIAQSRDLLEWLIDHGVYFQPALTGTLSLDRTNAFFLGGGKALLNSEYRCAQALGVRFFYETDVQEILIQHGQFFGARVKRQNSDTLVQAQAAVIACGGFQANAEWMRQVWGDAADNFLIRGTPYNKGTVLKDLINKGFDTVGDATQCHAVAVDARAPKYDGGIVSRLDSVCFSVVVNQQAQRFYDEGEDFWPKRYAIWGRLIAQQPDQIAYSIFDSAVVENFMPSAFPPLKANSLSELASLLRLDANQLETTVTTFNEAVVDANAERYDPSELDGCSTRGLDVEKSNWAKPIFQPPYYAYPLRPGITFTYLGLKVDSRARVYRDGEALVNLFAAGEVMAGNIFGQGYCAGAGMTIGGVFGRIAGREAACLTP